MAKNQQKKTKSTKKPEQVQETLVSSKAKAKESSSTQKFVNIKGIRDGILILENGSLRQIVMSSSINFSLLSPDEQKGKVFAYQDFLNSLNFPIQIIAQSRKLNIKGYLEKIKEMERMQENELLKLQTYEYGEYIASLVELANITTNHYYVVVPYTAPVLEAKGGFLDRIKDLVSPAKEVKQEIVSFRKGKEELSQRVSLVMGGLSDIGLAAAALDTQEVIELLYSWYNPTESATQILADIEELEIEK